MEDPPKKFFRLAPGREVRLRYAYFITCIGVGQGPATGEVVELRCSYDPQTRGGDAPDGRKVKGTHPLGLGRARRAGRGAPLRPPLHPRDPEDVEAGGDFTDTINPNSLEVLTGCRLEPALAAAAAGRAASSSSAWATSAPTGTPGRASRSSTAP